METLAIGRKAKLSNTLSVFHPFSAKTQVVAARDIWLKRRVELAVAVHEHETISEQKTVDRIGQVLAICVIQASPGFGVHPAKRARRVFSSMTNNR